MAQDTNNNQRSVVIERGYKRSGDSGLESTLGITEPFPADNPDFSEKNFQTGWTYTADALKQFVENNQ